MKNQTIKNILIGLSSLIAMWLFWSFAVILVDNEYVIPTVKETFISFFDLIKRAFFWKSICRTLVKVIIALAISFVFAGILSSLAKTFKTFGKFFNPFITVIRTLPTMAILVLILIYSTRTIAPIIVASLVLFPMIYAQFSQAFDTIDENVINTTKVFNLSRKQKLLKVYLPMIIPPVVSNTGSNLSFTIKLIISAEVMSKTYTSIGGMMDNAGSLMNVSELMALTIIAVILGLLVEVIFNLIFSRAFAWTKREAQND